MLISLHIMELLVLFTGLVETAGTITAIHPDDPGIRLIIQSSLIANDAQVGDSVCVSGCCLTVVQNDDEGLHFQAGEETLRLTTLGRYESGQRINLERSLRVGDRMGGHFVTGHVDGLGTVRSREDNLEWSKFWFDAPRKLLPFIASKGSITVDGVSLTIVDVDDNGFSVALIPHTLTSTTLGQQVLGDRINLETDILAKYVTQSRQFDE